MCGSSNFWQGKKSWSLWYGYSTCSQWLYNFRPSLLSLVQFWQIPQNIKYYYFNFQKQGWQKFDKTRNHSYIERLCVCTAFCLDLRKKVEVIFVGVLKTCSAQQFLLALNYFTNATSVRKRATHKDAEVMKLSSLQDKGASKCSGGDPLKCSPWM